MTAPTIALLDDDPAFLAYVHDVLAGEGYRVLRWCPGGPEGAHALLREAHPDLVILDLGLGGRRGGWELVKQLWGDCETTDIPVIVLADAPTLLPVRRDVLRAMRCRVARKPFAHHDLRDLCDLHDLLAATEDALGRSPAKRAAGESAYPRPADDAPAKNLHRGGGMTREERA